MIFYLLIYFLHTRSLKQWMPHRLLTLFNKPRPPQPILLFRSSCSHSISFLSSILQGKLVSDLITVPKDETLFPPKILLVLSLFVDWKWMYFFFSFFLSRIHVCISFFVAFLFCIVCIHYCVYLIRSLSSALFAFPTVWISIVSFLTFSFVSFVHSLLFLSFKFPISWLSFIFLLCASRICYIVRISPLFLLLSFLLLLHCRTWVFIGELNTKQTLCRRKVLFYISWFRLLPAHLADPEYFSCCLWLEILV